MKRKFTILVLVGGSACVVIAVILMAISQRKQATQHATESRGHSPSEPPRNTQPVASEALPITTTGETKVPTAAPILSESALAYDESLSFEKNLQRLKQFCGAHSQDPQLTRLLGSFVELLIGHAKAKFLPIKLELEQREGTVNYRNILLACLVSSDAPAKEQADLIWKVATDKDEKVEVRKTAAYLTSQVQDGQKRPEALFALLTDPDSDVVVSALANSTFHLDERAFNVIKTELINSVDIHVQVAAISALGRSPFPGKQQALKDIVITGSTSKADEFSEASLPKRSAIPHLDMHNADTYALVRQIALNDSEDPGVRAKAISKFTPAEFPAEEKMLVTLLQSLNENDTVPLRAVVDTLLTSPTSERIRVVRERANELSDAQVRNLILKRIEIATKGDTQ